MCETIKMSKKTDYQYTESAQTCDMCGFNFV